MAFTVRGVCAALELSALNRVEGSGNGHFSDSALRFVCATRRGLRPGGLHGAKSGRGARTAGPGGKATRIGPSVVEERVPWVQGIECPRVGSAFQEWVRESGQMLLHETLTAAEHESSASNDGVCLRAATIGRLMPT